ncbi:MAG: aspartate/glutamate racemase family protein [Candidatus Heimdallarchaeaceae archaeon]
MKKIGIIGGLSPESTIEYYKIISRDYIKLKGGVSSPLLAIESLDLQTISNFMKEDNWDKVYDFIYAAAVNLIKIGAEVIIIATNTIHKIFDKLVQAIDVPMISIMDATAEKVKEAGITKVGLLGTAFTMQSDFYHKVFKEYGLEIITPCLEDQNYINKIIWYELTRHILKQESKQGYLEIIQRLQQKGAEGVILGCTEIPLLIKQEDCSVPVFDTTTIHAKAALKFALSEENKEIANEIL